MGYSSLNHILHSYSETFLQVNNSISSRNSSDLGSNRELINESIVLDNPRARNLYLEGRKNNLFATWAELIWVLGGDSKLDPVMSTFLPRCKDFSDDGLRWRGAYNTRIQKYDLLNHVIEMFKQDGLNTRRACFSIWNPVLDSYEAIKNQHPFSTSNLEVTKDMPCTSFIWFWVRDNKFNCKVGLRSNDIIWGLSSINVFEFTVIQEIIYEKLKVIYPDLELGVYIHNPISLHVYEKTFSQIEEICKSEDNKNRLVPLENFPIKISRYNELQTSLKDIYLEFERCVVEIQKKELLLYYAAIERMKKVFEMNNIPVENNSLYIYATLPLVYLTLNKFKSDVGKLDFKDYISKNSDSISPDIKEALTKRYFL